MLNLPATSAEVEAIVNDTGLSFLIEKEAEAEKLRGELIVEALKLVVSEVGKIRLLLTAYGNADLSRHSYGYWKKPDLELWAGIKKGKELTMQEQKDYFARISGVYKKKKESSKHGIQ